VTGSFMAGLVLPAHRPTLPELLRPRLARVPRPVRIAAVALGAALVIAIAYLSLRPGAGENEYVQRGSLEFNFRYPDALSRAEPRGGELVRVQQRRDDGLFVQSMAVEALRLPAYRGEVVGLLPLYADREIRALAGRFESFELVQDGKTRLNEVPGYVIAFRARLGERRLFGRTILLPEPEPGARSGVRLVLLATPSAGVNRAEEVGMRGIVKRPYRTFRFGTEAP
jgi:hypothetical protein